MINVSGNKWIPSEGYTYISNGDVWTDSIFLGSSDNIDNWHDTNEEPPEYDELTDNEALNIITGRDEDEPQNSEQTP